eukprot:m.382796 g.382796  ORF g.382796 m.382796 type:complete len:291 (-) comp20045_c7_seq51:45-917(-)
MTIKNHKAKPFGKEKKSKQGCLVPSSCSSCVDTEPYLLSPTPFEAMQYSDDDSDGGDGFLGSDGDDDDEAGEEAKPGSKRKNGPSSVFADADEFAHLLEDAAETNAKAKRQNRWEERTEDYSSRKRSRPSGGRGGRGGGGRGGRSAYNNPSQRFGAGGYGYQSRNTGGGQVYDGKRMRKAVKRPTIDYMSSSVNFLEANAWLRDPTNTLPYLQPDHSYFPHLMPPAAYLHEPTNAVTTRHFHTSMNKVRCPINVVKWTPEGRRLVTGASSGEFTLWNGLTFNFETILQVR